MAAAAAAAAAEVDDIDSDSDSERDEFDEPPYAGDVIPDDGVVTVEGADITFVSSDGERFTVPRGAAFMSRMAARLAGSDAGAAELPLENVAAAELRIVLDFCRARVGKKMPPTPSPLKSSRMEDVLDAADMAFVKDMPRPYAVELLMVADFMDVRELQVVLAVYVACGIKTCRTGAEVREMFDIPYEWDPAEEARVLDENKWSADEVEDEEEA